MAGPVLPESARGIQLFCCVALCLLGTGPAGAGVTQSPRHLVKGSGGKAVLKCRPMSGHRSVSWYQQAPGQGPQFLIELFDQETREKGNLPSHFSVEQFSDYSSQLNMSSLELGDSASYLCASSLGTALPHDWLSVLKLSCPS